MKRSVTSQIWYCCLLVLPINSIYIDNHKKFGRKNLNDHLQRFASQLKLIITKKKWNRNKIYKIYLNKVEKQKTVNHHSDFYCQIFCDYLCKLLALNNVTKYSVQRLFCNIKQSLITVEEQSFMFCPLTFRWIMPICYASACFTGICKNDYVTFWDY